MSEVTFYDEGGTLLGVSERHSIVFSAGSTGSSSNTPLASPTMPRVKSEEGESEDVEPWGDDNDYPRRIVEAYSRNTVIPATLGERASELVGGGLIAMKVVGADNDGNETLEYVQDPEIQDFLSSFQLEKTLFELAQDLVWFFNAWVELIPNANRTKIIGVTHQEAAFCRWEKQNKSTGRCERVWIASDWPNPEKKNIIKLPAIDPYTWNSIEQVRESKDSKFMYPLIIPTVSRVFYQLPHHDAIRTSGWLDVVQAVPAYKKFMMRNQMSLKYHFEIDEAYWPLLYGQNQWEKWDAKQRVAKKKKWIQDMTDTLTDVKKAGKAIITPKVWGDGTLGHGTDYRQYITINTLQDITQDGKYVEDVMEGTAQILYALSVDPTTKGFLGGAKMGSRSGGSDKREAFTISNIRNSPARRALLEPIRWIAKYNGWEQRHPGLRILTKSAILTTLDTGTGSKAAFAQ